ncbi:MAG TPA: hypothetical protein PKD96_03160 [Candidatus Absconditabacterales bacterium]|nr:hypothetical protein [Candidatus Absconditabacterales bacterium]HMT27277.1 hypothetical protein [Candidatus Absconditabacterales bacterium]
MKKTSVKNTKKSVAVKKTAPVAAKKVVAPMKKVAVKAVAKKAPAKTTVKKVAAPVKKTVAKKPLSKKVAPAKKTVAKKTVKKVSIPVVKTQEPKGFFGRVMSLFSNPSVIAAEKKAAEYAKVIADEAMQAEKIAEAKVKEIAPVIKQKTVETSGKLAKWMDDLFTEEQKKFTSRKLKK